MTLIFIFLALIVGFSAGCYGTRRASQTMFTKLAAVVAEFAIGRVRTQLDLLANDRGVVHKAHVEAACDELSQQILDGEIKFVTEDGLESMTVHYNADFLAELARVSRCDTVSSNGSPT